MKAKNCCTNENDHCCWLGEKGQCKYLLKERSGDRYWVCGLLKKYGNWYDMYASEEYIKDVKPFYDKWRPGTACNDYPLLNEFCQACNSIGSK